MDSKDEKIVVVENGFNTCYIDSLLMGLFYTPSVIFNNMLENDPTNPDFLYLQEMIKTNFIEQVRKDISISSDIVNEIRNYSFINGWKINEPHELSEQQDITEYYTFLSENLNNQLIHIERYTITEGIESKNDVGEIEKIPFITLSTNEFEYETNIKNLLKIWLNDNPIDITRDTIENNIRITKNIKGLNVYKICNVPCIVPLFINRFTRVDGLKLLTKIDINKKIKLIDNSNFKWMVHSVICHSGDTLKSGHYYTILINNTNWYMFDDMSVPSLKEIDMSDNQLIDKIKRECVFIIYKFYN